MKRRHLAIAAAMLVAVGGVLFLLWRPSRTTDEELQRAATHLARAEPELFTDFHPLLAGERGERLPVSGRGGVRIREPRGTILDPSPTFAWEDLAEATVYHVSVRDQGGRVVFQQEVSASRLAYPAALVDPLPRGARFVVAVEARTPTGPIRGSEAFRTLEETAAARYERGLTVIGEQTEEPERAVLSAHWAIRHGLFSRARAHLPENRNASVPVCETWDWLDNRMSR